MLMLRFEPAPRFNEELLLEYLNVFPSLGSLIVTASGKSKNRFSLFSYLFNLMRMLKQGKTQGCDMAKLYLPLFLVSSQKLYSV